jgi:Flp pilus assembly protein TadB
MNIDLHNCREYIKEVFWMFYFLPIMASLITALILIVLHRDWYFLVPAVLVGGYCLQNMLFFMKYGKRKKNFHGGSE